jgi:uncharacterized protein (DUF1330 family)
MSAYLIVNLDVHDPEAYEEYKTGAAALVTRHGGEYLVRGGDFDVLEGDWTPTRLVILTFPTRSALDAFFTDPDYAPLKAIRHSSATTDAIAVEGV